jgi:hypothetical protein
MTMPIACRRCLFAALAGLFAVSLAQPSAEAAQSKKKAAPKTEEKADAPPANPDDKDQPKVKVERGAGGKKVYKIEGEIVIEGKIQKPEAFYVLQKSSINYDWNELKQEFVPKILDSVKNSPF